MQQSAPSRPSLPALVSLPNEAAPRRGNAELLADDDAVVLRPWTAAGEPLPIVEGHGSFVRDADGRVYLDFTAGYFVNQAGHSHPRVIAAAVDQLHRVSQVSGRHASEPAIDLAKALVQLAPGALAKVLYTTGGSESTEFAIKMARQATGKRGLVVLDNGFHGLSVQALAACGNDAYRASAAAPLDPSIVRATSVYCYRCEHQRSCRAQCVSGLEAALDAHPDTGAILAEPMQAVGGLAPPKIWWERVDALRRTRGLLLVLDEIQTGLGRTGTMFAAEHYGLAPDIMTLAKGLSGGVGSLGAVLCTAEVAARFSGATSPTSAANAVSCAAGLSLLRVIQDERLCENAAAMGALLAAQVIALDRPEIGDVRFHGLLGGIELVHDREHKTPWTKAEIRGLKDALLARGVIVTATGPLGNVIRVQPPLSVSPGEIDLFVALFGEALAGRRSGIQ